MRIFYAGNFLSESRGSKGAGEELVEQFKLNGHTCIVASRYPERIRRMTDFLFTAIVNKGKYDVVMVEVYSNLAFFWAELLCKFLKLLKKPYILILHGGGLVEFHLKNNHRVNKFLQSANAVTSPSLFLINHFRKIRPDIHNIPNGIEISKYEYKPRETIQPKISWLRAFHQIYNPKMAVKAINFLQENYPDSLLWMIGPDKQDGSKQECKQLVEESKLRKNIQFVGSIEKEEVPDWLNKSDIFINTTNYESFGVAVVEAAACGLCIVTTNVGELAFLWKDEVDALLVPPDDSLAMAAAIDRLISDPDLAKRLSENGRKKAESFNWSNILPKWENLLLSITPQKRL